MNALRVTRAVDLATTPDGRFVRIAGSVVECASAPVRLTVSCSSAWRMKRGLRM